MTDISVIILVGQEQLHIARCLEKLAALEPRQIFVVESQKGDRTHEIAAGKGATTVWHDWPGTQARQFNWALDHLPIDGAWVLRLDEDEYLTDEGIVWLKANLGTVSADVPALELVLERKFCGGVIRHATNGIRQVRMFRRGRARYEETLMDERLIVGGKTLQVPVTFYDDNLRNMDWWRAKHRGYAKREAEQALAGLTTGIWTDPRKATYYRLPPYFRALVYFGIRYFLKLGFLDGRAGFLWNFWQGFWYRLLVDREISRLLRRTH